MKLIWIYYWIPIIELQLIDSLAKLSYGFAEQLFLIIDIMAGKQGIRLFNLTKKD